MKNKLSRISARDSAKDFYNFVFGTTEAPKVNIRGVACSIKLSYNGRRRSKYVNNCYVEIGTSFGAYHSETVEVRNFRYEEDLLDAMNAAIEQVVILASNQLGPKKEAAFNQQKAKVDRLTLVVDGIDAIIQRITANKEDERFTIKDENLASFTAVKTQIQQLANANEFDDLAENAQIQNIDPDDIQIKFFVKGQGEFAILGADRGNKKFKISGPSWKYEAYCDTGAEIDEAMNAMITLGKFANR